MIPWWHHQEVVFTLGVTRVIALEQQKRETQLCWLMPLLLFLCHEPVPCSFAHFSYSITAVASRSPLPHTLHHRVPPFLHKLESKKRQM